MELLVVDHALGQVGGGHRRTGTVVRLGSGAGVVVAAAAGRESDQGRDGSAGNDDRANTHGRPLPVRAMWLSLN